MEVCKDLSEGDSVPQNRKLRSHALTFSLDREALEIRTSRIEIGAVIDTVGACLGRVV